MVNTVPEESLFIPFGKANVMFSIGRKFAVRVPAPLIVAVVEAAEGLPRVIDPVDVHELKT